MGTLVTIRLVRAGADAAVARAFEWFHEVERRCTRFDSASELMQLTARTGIAVPASAILFEAVRFALAVADESGGAFDPTVGHAMEERGFDREHRSGTTVRTAAVHGTWRDVEIDEANRTITLHRPVVLDLGAVAKGLAVDAAARELAPFGDFAIDAGGDLYLGGRNPQGAPWSIGIRHPRQPDELIDTVRVSDRAVCTSGDYERPGHLLDPLSRKPASAAASATVIAPSAMVADALATAAFVLGPVNGIALLDRMGVQGLIVTPELELIATEGLRHAA